MKYIHEQSNWPSFVYDAVKLLPMVADVRHRQGLLYGRMSTLGFSLCSEASLEILTSDIVKSSGIEGETLDYIQVRSSIARKCNLDTGGFELADRAVDGIVEIMLDAVQHYDDILTEDRLFGWHSALFPSGRSGMRKINVAAWRSAEADPMQVVSGPIGRQKVHYEAPAAHRLGHEVGLFFKWFNSPSAIDPMLKAGIAHFWFVTIHPFEDGNGRIARVITNLSLARADGNAERFYSMSVQIEKERNAYYAILEKCQKGGLDITLWLEWFLACLGRAIRNSDEIIGNVLHKAHVWQRVNRYPVNERQRKVINAVLADFKGNLTSSKYAKLAKCSQDTALRDINELLQYGILVQNPGGGRSTSYQMLTNVTNMEGEAPAEPGH